MNFLKQSKLTKIGIYYAAPMVQFLKHYQRESYGKILAMLHGHVLIQEYNTTTQ
jgi:hypothetical protein